MVCHEASTVDQTDEAKLLNLDPQRSNDFFLFVPLTNLISA